MQLCIPIAKNDSVTDAHSRMFQLPAVPERGSLVSLPDIEPFAILHNENNFFVNKVEYLANDPRVILHLIAYDTFKHG